MVNRIDILYIYIVGEISVPSNPVKDGIGLYMEYYA